MERVGSVRGLLNDKRIVGVLILLAALALFFQFAPAPERAGKSSESTRSLREVSVEEPSDMREFASIDYENISTTFTIARDPFRELSGASGSSGLSATLIESGHALALFDGRIVQVGELIGADRVVIAIEPGELTARHGALIEKFTIPDRAIAGLDRSTMNDSSATGADLEPKNPNGNRVDEDR